MRLTSSLWTEMSQAAHHVRSAASVVPGRRPATGVQRRRRPRSCSGSTYRKLKAKSDGRGVGGALSCAHTPGLGGASCAPADCTGHGQNHQPSCYVSSDYLLPDPMAPTGCYAGASGPPPGTVLAAGEALTWAAARRRGTPATPTVHTVAPPTARRRTAAGSCASPEPRDARQYTQFG